MRVGPVAALAVLAACAPSGAPAERPNVLLVTLDTTRADYLSCYGGPAGGTPTLDRLAAEGTRFDLALSASAVTPVSHATILTGLFPYRHGLRVLHADGGFRLPDDRFWLPEALQRAGWSTAAVHSAFPVSGYFGLDRAFGEVHDFRGALEEGVRPTGTAWDMDELQRRSDESTDIALDVLERLPEPWFLWLHYWDPHDDLRLPPDGFLADHGLSAETAGNKDDATYAAEVAYVDAELGRVVERLRSRGALARTLVVVTADHGEGLSDGVQRHGWRGHRLLYQEQIHVPLIVRPPDGASARRQPAVGELVRTADIAPTVLDYAGVPAPDTLDGASLRPLVEGRRDAPRVAYADQINGYDRNAHMVERRPDAAFLYTVSDGRWKLTYRPHLPDEGELFDLAADPGEVRNLWRKHPAEVRRLLLELARREPWVTAPLPPDGAGGDEGDASAALHALGYAAGAVADVEWSWTCVEHRAAKAASPGRCPRCGEPLLPEKADPR